MYQKKYKMYKRKYKKSFPKLQKDGRLQNKDLA